VTMQAPPALPFKLGSRTLIEHVQSQNFVLGTRLDFPLRKVGYLDGLLVRLTGTWTIGAATPDERPGFPHNIVSRFVLNIPGLAHPISQSGYLMKIQNLLAYDFGMHRRGWDPVGPLGIARLLDSSGGAANDTLQDVPAAYAEADIANNFADLAAKVNALIDDRSYSWLANAFAAAELDDRAPIVLNAANDVDLWWYVPAHRSARDLRGIMPIGGDQDTVLEVYCGALADIFDATAQVTANDLDVEVYQVFHTAPPPGVMAPDTSWAIVYDEYSQVVAATGDNNVEIPRDGVLLNVVHAVWLDDDLYPTAPETAISSLSLRVNRDKLLDQVPYVAYAKLAAMRGDKPLPAGIIAYDFDFRQADIPFYDAGHERQAEWLFSAGVTEIESRIAIASGTALDNATIKTSVKRLMRI
jgi:hypothetical protein